MLVKEEDVVWLTIKENEHVDVATDLDDIEEKEKREVWELSKLC